jgi:hypothetical protein
VPRLAGLICVSSCLLVAAFVGGCALGLPAPLATAAGTPATIDPALSAACERGRLEAFVRAIRTVTYDYEPFDGPREQVAAADLVVVGRIVGVAPGRVLPGLGRHGSLTVAVDEVVSGDEGAVQDGLVFMELPMEPADIDAARRSLPATRVLLFLDSVTDGQDIPRGRPARPPIFAPFVQGVILEACPGYVNALVDPVDMAPAWREAETFDDLVAFIREA